MFVIIILSISTTTFVMGQPTKTNLTSAVTLLPDPPLMKPVAPLSVNVSLSLDNKDASDFTSATLGLHLPTALKPTEYFIKIFPILSEYQHFRGYVDIDLKVLESTSVIYLNMADIHLDFASLKVTTKGLKGRESINITDHALYPEKQVGTFTLEKPLSVGDTVRFSSSYSGNLVNNSYGLNQILYKEKDGTQKRVLATYFQPVGARRVFPCMDEPNLKARFVLHIAKPKGNTVLSNMQINRTFLAENGAYSWCEFQKSLPMSPYLVAFVISDFSTRSRKSKVRVWSRRSVLIKSMYASSLAPRTVRWFETYLGVPYPLPKLDLVTFPSYIVPGMENFGLITTAEASLLTNGKLTRKEWVATVTAHEVAHQWAGNLVTPVWWSQYWLSEGFATYLAARALDELLPSMEATNHMVVKNTQLVLRQDDGETASVIVEKHFDPLLAPPKNIPMYFKGAALLRLLNALLGEESFSKAMKEYFRKFQFKSVSESDFYAVITKFFAAQPSRPNCNQILPTTLDRIMESWTTQKGYPLITVTRNPDGRISVKQEVFEKKYFNVSTASLQTIPTDSSRNWWIPISFATSRDPDFSRTCPRTWLLPSKDPLTLEGVTAEDSWIVMNIQQSPYGRVNYDEGLWRAIASRLVQDPITIHVLNRAQLVDDAFYLFTTGHIGSDPPMRLLAYLAKEDNFYPLNSALAAFRNIELVMRDTPNYPLLKKYALSFLSPLLKSKFNQGLTDQKRYQLVLSWACKFQHPDCIKIALETFNRWKEDYNMRVFPEMAIESILCSVIEQGTPQDWNVVFKRFIKMSDWESRKPFIDALSCTKDETVIRKYLNNIADPIYNLTSDNARHMFNSAARSHRWNQFVWNYLITNYDRLDKRFAGTPLPFVTTEYDLEQLKVMLKSQFAEVTDEKGNSIDFFLADGIRYAGQTTRIISTVSNWLVENAPSFV